MHIQTKIAMQGHKLATRKAKRIGLLEGYYIVFENIKNIFTITLLKRDGPDGCSFVAQWTLSNKYEWIEEEGGCYDAS